MSPTKSGDKPQVNSAEPESNDDRNEAGGDLHVLLVGHGQDDEQQQGGPQHLVHRQAHCCDLDPFMRNMTKSNFRQIQDLFCGEGGIRTKDANGQPTIS